MISDFQNVFVRIATDAAFRSDFLADPEEAFGRYSLSEKERCALLGLSREGLERYADSLLAKRSDEFCRAVPLSLRICPSLKVRYKHWLTLHPSPKEFSVLDPGLSEALRSCSDLADEIAKDPAETPYAADLLIYEVFRKASVQDSRIRFMKSRFRVDLIAHEIRNGLVPMDPAPFAAQFRFDEKGSQWKKQ